MKRIKKFAVLFLSLVLLGLAVGCSDEPFLYSFRQDLSNVTKVEICAYDSYYDNATTLEELTDNDAATLLSSVAALPCYKYFPGDHDRSYGPVIIRIHYIDCEIEMIGPINVGYITPKGVHLMKEWYFKETDILDLIQEYTDASLLPDLSEFYE